MIAFFCAIAGALCAWHLRVLQRDSELTHAKVLMRIGTTRPMYTYTFTVNDEKFTGTWVGPDRPLYEEGDIFPVTYYRPNPHVSNGGHALEPMPLETAQGWFTGAAIAAGCALYLGVMAKSGAKEYPWS